jgi:cytochrome c
LYQLRGPLNGLPQIIPNQAPNQAFVSPSVALTPEAGYRTPFDGMGKYFYAEVTGFLKMSNTADFQFRFQANEGARLFIDDSVYAQVGAIMPGMPAIDATGSIEFSVSLDTELHPFRIEYFNYEGEKNLLWEWYIPGIKSYSEVPGEVIRCYPPLEPSPAPGIKMGYTGQARAIPGDTWPLPGLHPSLEVEAVSFPGFFPKVGGLDVRSDSGLLIATWDAVGGVFLLQEQEGAEPSLQRIAAGLSEPLGLKVVDDQIYVLQRQELTQLVDLNGDGLTDEFRSVASGWSVTDNEREFASALAHDGEHFFIALTKAADKDGLPLPNQSPDRGSIIRVNKDGSFERVVEGAYAPMGLLSTGTDLWYTDVSPPSQAAASLSRLGQNNPVAWMPRGMVADVPTEILLLNSGPYADQLLVADVTNGGLRRVAPEQINGQWQAAVFRFSQGFTGGINRFAQAPDGSIYAGESGYWEEWSQAGHQNNGIERIRMGEAQPFEMTRIQAHPNGLEISFSEAIAPGYGNDPADYQVMSWDAVSGKPELKPVEIEGIALGADRTSVQLQLADMKTGTVLFLRIRQAFPSVQNHALWSTEAWYTLNQLPKGQALALSLPAATELHNVLSEAEKAAGWELLFDGKTTQGFRSFKQQELATGWQVVDGAVSLEEPGAGDLVTEQIYDNFELQVEWSIEEGGNSGIFFHVSEEEEKVWHSGPEVQLLDDLRHPDNKQHTHRSGSNYDLQGPAFEALNPPGAYNHLRLLVDHGHVEHWLNGYKVVEYELGSPEWEAQVANSKFADWPGFGRAGKGVIAFQDHGDPVRFRSMKIRKLPGKK